MRRLIVILAAVLTALTAHAEQKNVKLLTGMTDLELQRTMNLMRASLGTHCDYCHVIKEKWDFASDENPKKGRAREMIQMVSELNRTRFGGRAVISCYSCHRGATRPVNLVPLPQTPPPFPTPPAPEQPQLPDAKALAARYAAALGDVTRLANRVFIGEVTKGPATMPIEIRVKGTKVQQITHLPNGNFEQVFDGTSYWYRDADGSGTMTPAGEENFRVLTDAFALPLPSEIGDDSSTFRQEKVGDRDAWVVQRGQPRDVYRRFYFDTETGLLLRMVIHTPRPIGTIPQQTDYEDYRDVDGTKVPFRVRVSLVDPWSSATRQYTSVQLGAKIDDAVFEMPK